MDLVGIEPTTSSMPWNYQGSWPLILKQLLAGQAGKTGINSAICYQIATKVDEWDRRADSWGISPSYWRTIADCLSRSPVPDWVGCYFQQGAVKESISQPSG